MNLQYVEQAYRTTMVNTSLSAIELIVYLYEAAIENLKKAIDAIATKDVNTKCGSISKTIAIIEELINSLNHEIAEELTENLESLYLYMLQELTIANVTNDTDKIRHVINLLQTLYSAWRELK